MLCDELHEALNSSDEVDFHKTGREFFLREPRPATPMINLKEVHTIHPDFVRWMQDDPDRDMSDDVYGNVRSAVMSLFLRRTECGLMIWMWLRKKRQEEFVRSMQLQRQKGRRV